MLLLLEEVHPCGLSPQHEGSSICALDQVQHSLWPGFRPPGQGEQAVPRSGPVSEPPSQALEDALPGGVPTVEKTENQASQPGSCPDSLTSPFPLQAIFFFFFLKLISEF